MALFASASFAQKPIRTVYPGDAIQLTREDDPNWSVRLVVDSDGSVSLPELGPVVIATLNAKEISKKIVKLYLERVGRTIPISVTTCYVKGAPIEISGAVVHPMKFRFVHAPSLQKLVEIASPTDQADSAEIDLLHADGSSEIVGPNEARHLEDGDRVYIPFATHAHAVEVTGGVQNPSHLVLRGSLTVSEALGAAGGIATRGNASRIVVIRMGEPIPIRLPDDAAFPLASGDELRVDVAARIRHVLVDGKVKHPGLTDFKAGMTLTQALAAAGGIDESNRSDLVFLSQAMKDSKSAVKLSLRYLYTHRIPDPVLSEDDVVHVGPLEPAKKR